MLEWNEVGVLDSRLSYEGNIKNGSNLPELDKEVLFCVDSFYEPEKDAYFAGKLRQGQYGFQIVSSVLEGTVDLLATTKWAEINRPWTANNTKLAVAFRGKNGKDFEEGKPYIARLENNTLSNLKRKGFKDITIFRYQEPCTFDYTWEYVNENKE